MGRGGGGRRACRRLRRLHGTRHPARLAIWTDVFVVECVRGVRFVDLGFDALLNWERAMPAITWVSALGGLLVVGAAVVVVIQAAKGKSGGDR